MLPSSHSSLTEMMLSPQLASAHSFEQASSLLSLPSSQPSPGPTRASPQTAFAQLSVHVPLSLLASPASHSSPESTAPSPQIGGMKVSDSSAVASLSPVVVLVGVLDASVPVDASVLVGAPVLVDAPALVASLEVLASVAELVGAVVADDGPLVEIVPPLSRLSPLAPPHAAIISAAHEQTN